jgi:excisionase family DNA binding protein
MVLKDSTLRSMTQEVVTTQRREFLSVQEVAARLNVHPETIRRKIAEGSIPAVRLGDARNASLRIPAEALTALLWAAPREELADAES